MEGVRPPPKPDDRKRVLADLEIVAAWRASYRLNEPWGSFVRLLFATLQRRNEVAGVPWKELSRPNAIWRIDADRAKNDEDHLCPLNGLAMAEFNALGWKSRGLAITTTGKTAVSGFSRMKRQLDREMLPILQALTDARAATTGEDPQPVKLERWTLHDIRRTGTTGMQSLGVPVEHTEAVLNHKSGQAQKGVAKVYNLWKYEPEKREALRKWGGFLSALVAVGDGTTALSIIRAGMDERSAGAMIHQLAADMFAVAGEPSNVIPLAARRV
jgi:integrase